MLRVPCVAAAIALAIAPCSPPPPAPPLPPDPPRQPLADPGPVWRPRRFERATEGCTQTWACDCRGVSVRAGCHAVPSGNATTQGSCATDTGPLSGCTRCMALEPVDPCTCTTACP